MAVIYPAAFLMAVTMGLMTLGMVLYARLVLEAGGARIGVLAGIWSLTYVFGCLVVRPWFNRVLPRFLIIGSTATMAVVVVVMLGAETYGMLLVLYALFGLALSLFWPPLMGWVSTNVEGPHLGRVIGRFNMSWCSGAVISPFICGWLSGINPRYPLMLAVGLMLFVCVFVAVSARLLPGIGSDRGTGAAHDALPGDTDGSSPLRFPAWIGLYASFFGLGTITAVFPLVALEAWHAVEKVIGLVFTGRGLANVVGFILLGRIHAWHHKLIPMLAAQWVAVVSLAVISLAGSVITAAVLLAVFGFCSAMSYASSFFHGTVGSLNRARRMAVHESILAGGLVSGSIAGGWIYEKLASNTVFFVVAVILAGLTIVQTMVGRSVNTRDEIMAK